MTEAGISTSKLARQLDITERTVAHWRAGDSEPSYQMRLAISLALGRGADVGWLYNGEGVAA